MVCCVQDVHTPLLSSAVREGMSAAQLSVPVRQAAFMEAADCFAAMLPDPQVDNGVDAPLLYWAGLPLCHIQRVS